MNKPHFVGWKNVEEGYYTKTTLRNVFGLKPIDESQYDATLRAYMNGKWKDFYLYHIDNCVEINKQKVKKLPITLKNISEALYLINKSAKKSRDTKIENYYYRRHKVVSAAKTRQNKLYNLKDQVIKKLLNEQFAVVLGYHIQTKYVPKIHLKLIKIGEFSFHQLATLEEVKELEFLGDIDTISSDKTIDVSINFFESINLLNRYVNGENLQQQSLT